LVHILGLAGLQLASLACWRTDQDKGVHVSPWIIDGGNKVMLFGNREYQFQLLSLCLQHFFCELKYFDRAVKVYYVYGSSAGAGAGAKNCSSSESKAGLS
jgi:hypothetical protein